MPAVIPAAAQHAVGWRSQVAQPVRLSVAMMINEFFT